jgi:hypothetical protein
MIDVKTGTAGGDVVFDRLYWRAWKATLNGARVPCEPLDGIFLKVHLPPHASGALSIRYTPPGMRIGFALFTIGLGAALAKPPEAVTSRASGSCRLSFRLFSRGVLYLLNDKTARKGR